MLEDSVLGSHDVPQFISEDRCKVMIIEGLREYESKVVEPRHRETQRELGQIKNIVSQGRGAIWMIGILFTVVMAALEVYRVVHK